MREFDYKDRYKKVLTPDIVALISKIHEFKGGQASFMEAKADALTKLIEIAKIQSTQASNKIEGIYTSDDRLKKIVKDKTMPKTRNEKEIAGYRDVLNTIHKNYDYLPLKSSVFLQLHRDLYKFTGNSGGHYKIADNLITQEDEQGNQAVRFRPASAWETSAGDDTATGEPTECALVNYAAKLGINKKDAEAETPREEEVPFDSGRKMMSTLHVDKKTGRVIQYTKGAPDEVLKKCTHILSGSQMRPITDEDKKNILSANKEMADKALRVLMASYAEYDQMPEKISSEDVERELCFIGLVGMIDPVRPEVKAAIEECDSAGITPVMITGDHVDTAAAIGKELGILSEGRRAITGAMLNEMDDETFEKEIEEIGVYARVQPEHKVRIVNMWKKKGYVTAMTGDGVNDAPSIKSADIGVGMGITGDLESRVLITCDSHLILFFSYFSVVISDAVHSYNGISLSASDLYSIRQSKIASAGLSRGHTPGHTCLIYPVLQFTVRAAV